MRKQMNLYIILVLGILGFSSTSFANPSFFGGVYSINGQSAEIKDTAPMLFVRNEHGTIVSGYKTSDSTFEVPAWGNLVATKVGDDIHWSNGTVWELEFYNVHLSLNYYNNGMQASTQILYENHNGFNEKHFLFTNEFGGQTIVRALDHYTIVAEDWGNLQGTLVYENLYPGPNPHNDWQIVGKILWANGAVWDNDLPNLPPALDIEGVYSINGQSTEVIRFGNELIFVNEFGSVAKGHIVSENPNPQVPTISAVVDDWGGLTATFRLTPFPYNEKIDFGNGTSWIKSTSAAPPIANVEGNYAIGNQLTKIYQSGYTLVFKNEAGSLAMGELVDESTVIANDWGGLVGTIQNGSIHWHNGSVWSNNLPAPNLVLSFRSEPQCPGASFFVRIENTGGPILGTVNLNFSRTVTTDGPVLMEGYDGWGGTPASRTHEGSASFSNLNGNSVIEFPFVNVPRLYGFAYGTDDYVSDPSPHVNLFISSFDGIGAEHFSVLNVSSNVSLAACN